MDSRLLAPLHGYSSVKKFGYDDPRERGTSSKGVAPFGDTFKQKSNNEEPVRAMRHKAGDKEMTNQVLHANVQKS